MKRAEILEQAKICVCGKREEDYGSPEDNFKQIAKLWTAYKGTEFTALDVSMMMALMKVARIKSGTATDDSFVVERLCLYKMLCLYSVFMICL